MKLLSRNRKRKNGSCPEIAEAMAAFDGDFILDAEIVAFNGDVVREGEGR